MPLKQLLRDLENAGEVDLGVIGHNVLKESGTLQVKSIESLCFVLDAPTNKKKKAKVAWNLTEIKWNSTKIMFSIMSDESQHIRTADLGQSLPAAPSPRLLLWPLVQRFQCLRFEQVRTWALFGAWGWQKWLCQNVACWYLWLSHLMCLQFASGCAWKPTTETSRRSWSPSAHVSALLVRLIFKKAKPCSCCEPGIKCLKW